MNKLIKLISLIVISMSVYLIYNKERSTLMEENNNKNRGVFYAVIGIATLVVAVIGATFAYFTAAAQNGANVINGNMASIGFDLVVEKVVDPGASSGMIPMSNSMVETAINKSSNNTCVDDNGNAVCQVYKVTVTNNSSATMFVDGYVALAGGSGVASDTTAAGISTSLLNTTTMRWAQVFKGTGSSEATSHYSTEGTQYLSVNHEEGTVGINSLDAPTASDSTGHNQGNILTSSGIITNNATRISGNDYDAVGKNFIRISNHKLTDGGLIDTSTEFNRNSDLTSMLVINQQIGASGNSGNSTVYYFVVWLTENGHDQTAGANVASVPATNNNFFNGIVRFISAQGSEVTATFTGFTAVQSDKAATNP